MNDLAVFEKCPGCGGWFASVAVHRWRSSSAHGMCRKYVMNVAKHQGKFK